MTEQAGRGTGDLTKKWAKFTQEYFLKRETLVSVLLLVDGSVPPLQSDLDVADWLGEHRIPFSVVRSQPCACRPCRQPAPTPRLAALQVFTKVDKRKKVQPGKRTRPLENVALFQEELAQTWEEFPPMVLTSASSGAGRSELLNHIAGLRNHWKANKGARRLGGAQEGRGGAASSLPPGSAKENAAALEALRTAGDPADW